MSKLVHVNKIEMIRIEELTPLKMIDSTSCRFERSVDFSQLEIKELVGVVVEDSYDNNQKTYTTTATFETKCKEPITSRHLAFRLTSVDGRQYMIGTSSRPYPIIKEKNNFPEKPNDSTMKTVTITWKAPLPMLLVI